MLNDKLRETDWEITDETINEQVARESYLQWLQDCQKQKQRRTPVCTNFAVWVHSIHIPNVFESEANKICSSAILAKSISIIWRPLLLEFASHASEARCLWLVSPLEYSFISQCLLPPT